MCKIAVSLFLILFGNIQKNTSSLSPKSIMLRFKKKHYVVPGKSIFYSEIFSEINWYCTSKLTQSIKLCCDRMKTLLKGFVNNQYVLLLYSTITFFQT